MSLYYGVSAGLQLLSVAFLSIALQGSTFANCSVRSNAQGGNAYGGAVSLYIGAYSSAYSKTGAAVVVAAGDTVVRNVNVTLDTVDFKSCSAIREQWKSSLMGSNVYGGSFSFHVGAYAWSYSSFGDSSSTCGSTVASGLRVHVQNTTSVDSRASTTSSGDGSYGANSYGGSMSVLHVGAYSWSICLNANSYSKCGATTASDVSVHVNGSGCSNCSANSTSQIDSNGANSYGGAFSAAFIGAYSYSYAVGGVFDLISRAFIGTTQVVRLSVTIQDSTIVDAVAASGVYCRTRSISMRTDLKLSFSIKRRRIQCQCECCI